MKDKYGRNIDYVRISVTDRCNLRCVYCMPEEGVPSVSHDKILTYDEITRLCRIFAKLGVKKIKLTGGEPLVRKNIASLVHDIKAIEGIEAVTLTTNGILLGKQAKELVEMGITAVNISLDTLQAIHFKELTRGGNIEDVMAGIDKMQKYPEIPLKINCVPNYITDSEVIALAELARTRKLHVRFIELMPIGTGKEMVCQMEDIYNQESRIKKLLEKKYGTLQPCQEVLGYGPSQYYGIQGFQGKIGFISAMSHKFCNQCNRVRLTAEGYLKTCLQYDVGENLFELLRGGAEDREIEKTILRAIEKKPKAHEFLETQEVQGNTVEHKGMSQIGG